MFTAKEYLSKIAELTSKLDALKPYDQTQLKNLQDRFRIGFIQNTNAIEGNTLSLSEVKVLLEDGVTIAGKTVRELKETLNHGDLMTELDNLFSDTKRKINEKSILWLHTTLMRGLVVDKHLWKWRTINIRVTGSNDIFPDPQNVPVLMSKFFESPICECKKFEDIARLHFEFVNIHPFVDGNGRIARLIMNLWLIKCWYFPIIIPVIIRNEYIESLRWQNFDKRYTFFLWQVYENYKDYLRFFSNK